MASQLASELGLLATISAVALSATSTVNKSYDGNNVADLSGTHTVLTGFIGLEGATVNSGVTGTFAGVNVGPGISITGGPNIFNVGYSIGNDSWQNSNASKNRYLFIYYGITF